MADDQASVDESHETTVAQSARAEDQLPPVPDMSRGSSPIEADALVDEAPVALPPLLSTPSVNRISVTDKSLSSRSPLLNRLPSGAVSCLQLQ